MAAASSAGFKILAWFFTVRPLHFGCDGSDCFFRPGPPYTAKRRAGGFVIL